ncbi:MAG: peptidoglycan-binding protein [Oscillospiraceae bacterium]|nr:peptidoglycan-binding protein [Oscillospiraceae bacterium]
MARAQLSTGSYNKTDTRYAQQLLNEQGYKLEVDGHYGPKTQAAVRKFQKANGLTVDGILGKNTWAALTTKAEPYKETPIQDYQYDGSKDKNYQALLEIAQNAEKDLTNPLDAYKQRLEAIAAESKDFSYDLANDPLYRQYRESYTRQGNLAMLDAMGQAASLTGGYGSSYGQMLGQQSYQSYLQKLGDAMPQLYSAALKRHDAQQEDVAQRYDWVLKQAQLDYDDYENQQKQVKALYDRAADAYKQGYDNWYDSYKNKASDKKALYSSIVSLITKTGYIPPTDQLKAAGMTLAEASAYADAYRR